MVESKKVLDDVNGGWFGSHLDCERRARNRCSTLKRMQRTIDGKRQGENPSQDRLGRHEQGSVRLSQHTRSRWDAKEHNTGHRPNPFSATSPLEGVKLVISEAAPSKRKGTVLRVIDVRTAYFHAQAERRVSLEPPEGDGGGPGS